MVVFGHTDKSKDDALMTDISNDVLLRRAVTGIYYCDAVRRKTSANIISAQKLGVEKVDEWRSSTDVYRLSVYPNRLLNSIIAGVHNDIELDPRRCTIVVYYVDLPNVELFGFSRSRHNYNTSDGYYSYMREVISLKSFSKSSSKLWELMKSNTVVVNSETSCLEIGDGRSSGSGVGGWSEYIASKGVKSVVCVDPGILRSTASSFANLSHVKVRIEDLLQSNSTSIGSNYDLCVCDMCCTIEEGIRMINRVATYMKTGGTLVMTFRWNPQRTAKTRSDSEELLSRLRHGLQSCDCADLRNVWLFANHKHERTITACFAP